MKNLLTLHEADAVILFNQPESDYSVDSAAPIQTV
jgi:hypothetical protein